MSATNTDALDHPHAVTKTAKPQRDVGRRTVWCDCLLTENLEIETLTPWAAGVPQPDRPERDPGACEAFKASIAMHLDHARTAAGGRRRWFKRRRSRAREREA